MTVQVLVKKLVKISRYRWPLVLAVYFTALSFPHLEAATIDVDKVIQIESSGNPKAYNKYSKATGLMQITPIALKDFNQINRTSYTMTDMKDPQKNMRVGVWLIEERIPQLLAHFKKPVTVDNVLISYNAGVNYVVRDKPLPNETKQYLKKYWGGSR